ncbi:hypothetical protein IIA79_04910 [bacterium]|nr:hypothetical protein [bacterium]
MASLSYLDVLRLSGDVFMGGLMTVTELGLPSEFIYSEPITADKLQVSLYGTTLGRYLMVDVVGKGLIEASKARGTPVIVGRSDLLALAIRVKRPLCQLSISNQRPFAEVGELQPRNETEVLVQLNDVQSPYVISIYDRISFPVEKHLPVFIECASRFDLLEPFQRVERTLELLKDGADE